MDMLIHIALVILWVFIGGVALVLMGLFALAAVCDFAKWRRR